MATKKKAKSRAKTKKKAKARTKVRSKAKSRPRVGKKKKAAVRRRPAARKAVRKKSAPKKTAKPAAAKKPPVVAPKPAYVPTAGETRVGMVTHYFSHLSVAVVRLENGMLREGDTIHIKGHTSDFRQRVGSMEVDRVHVSEARIGQSFGLKVNEHAREHDVVYKVNAP